MSFIHAVSWTRPDLAYLVSKGAKFMQAPGKAHISLLKKGLRYLRGKVDLCLLYDFSKPPLRQGLYGFFDASHADDVDTRRSTIAYVFFYSGCALSGRPSCTRLSLLRPIIRSWSPLQWLHGKRSTFGDYCMHLGLRAELIYLQSGLGPVFKFHGCCRGCGKPCSVCCNEAP